MTRPFTVALITGEAGPPGPRPAWRTPEPLQHLPPHWPIRSIDVVVVADLLIAIAVMAGTVSSLSELNGRAGQPVDGGLIPLAGLLVALPLALRDRWPLAAWRISVPAMIFVISLTREVYTAAEVDGEPYLPGVVFSYLLVLYAVGVRCSRQVSVGIWLLSFFGMWILHPDPSLFLGVIATGAALIYGYNVQVRRAAQRQVVEEERRTEDERAARAVLQERARIARELHDVVAHHMSVIAIQAEAAPIKAPDDPVVLRAELAGIRATALEALTELRRVLGVLREQNRDAPNQGIADGGPEPDTAPQPGLGDLDSLVAGARSVGSPVTLTVHGRQPECSRAVALATYRVLQEALSNVRRHAPGAPVEVEVGYHPDRITLRVENGPSAHPPTAGGGGGGQGLVGMRERVSACGGSLTTGPTAAGGFRVEAGLPLEVPTD